MSCRSPSDAVSGFSFAFNDFVTELKNIIKREPILAPILLTVASESNFGNAVARLISIDLGKDLDASLLYQIFKDCYNFPVNMLQLGKKFDNLQCFADFGYCDLCAVKERDPACDNHVLAFLHFKGFKAIQAHRIAHYLWNQNRKELALTIQSKCTHVYGVDIHPAAQIGPGLMIDHATGVVIGETSVVGRNCSFLHGVTLGSSGKERGDRHPKVGNDVLVGCQVTILGNITIGDCCKIGSGSVVLKSLPNNVTAVGIPAKIVGKSVCPNPGKSMDHALKNVLTSHGVQFLDAISLWADAGGIFDQVDEEHTGKCDITKVLMGIQMKYNYVSPPKNVVQYLFDQCDVDHDGYITKSEFELLLLELRNLGKTVTVSASKTVPTNMPNAAVTTSPTDSNAINNIKNTVQATAYNTNQSPAESYNNITNNSHIPAPSVSSDESSISNNNKSNNNTINIAALHKSNSNEKLLSDWCDYVKNLSLEGSSL